MADVRFTVRRIEARDAARWRELFDAYTRLYEREPDDEIARYTWKRIVDPGARAAGAGARMIDWLIEDVKRQGWARLYTAASCATRSTRANENGGPKAAVHEALPDYFQPLSCARISPEGLFALCTFT